MKPGETVRECRACRRPKELEHFRCWKARRHMNDRWVTITCHSRWCLDCEEAMERASGIAAYGRPRRAASYTTDDAALAVVDVNRLISTGVSGS
jgi:hypothetical protein